jgi:hypothetical protein
VTDSYIDSWNQTANMGQGANFSVRQSDIRSGLVRFELKAVPAGAIVTEATLNLWVAYVSNPSPLSVQIFMLRRPWDEDVVSWLEAETGVSWGKPGADDPVEDREAIPWGEVRVAEERKWASIDITRMVQYWVQHPEENYGLLLRGVGGTSVEYQFASSQWQQAQQRPKLLLTYELVPEAPKLRMVSGRDLLGWLMVIGGTLALLVIFVGRRPAASAAGKDKIVPS